MQSLRFNDSPDFITQRTPNGWTIRLKDTKGASNPRDTYRPWTVRVNGVLKSVNIDSGLPEDLPE